MSTSSVIASQFPALLAQVSNLTLSSLLPVVTSILTQVEGVASLTNLEKQQVVLSLVSQGLQAATGVPVNAEEVQAFLAAAQALLPVLSTLTTEVEVEAVGCWTWLKAHCTCCKKKTE